MIRAKKKLSNIGFDLKMEGHVNNLEDKKLQIFMDTLFKLKTLSMALNRIILVDDLEQIKDILSSTIESIKKLTIKKPECKTFYNGYTSKFQSYLEEVKNVKNQYKMDRDRLRVLYPILDFENNIREYAQILSSSIKDKYLIARLPDLSKSCAFGWEQLKLAEKRAKVLLKTDSGKNLFELINRFDGYESVLNELSQDTHCWEECAWTVTIIQYPQTKDAEGGSGGSRKLIKQKTPTREKCKYCSIERKTSSEAV